MIDLIAAMRLLGVQIIAYAFLIVDGVLGLFCTYIALQTSRGPQGPGDRDPGIPRVTTWLLFACGGVMCVCSICGLIGFKNLNRECMRWCFMVLTFRYDHRYDVP